MTFTLKEEFLHYIWKVRYFNFRNLRATTGQKIEVLSFGNLNSDAGPDFLEAKIRLDDELWFGQVEMHIKSSEWNRHGHSSDPKYQNVILHVVYEEDLPIYLSDGSRLLCLELKKLIFPKALERYNNLKISSTWIPCEKYFNTIPYSTIALTIQQMLASRLEGKARNLLEELSNLNIDFSELVYKKLGWAMGLKVNTFGFNQLTNRIPYAIVRKHRHSILQIEALFYGTSGLIPASSKSTYVLNLKREYQMLKNKFNLKPLDSMVWNFSRMRPAAFPSIRIGQFAMLLFTIERMDAFIIHASINEIMKKFNVSCSEYWSSHYRFDVTSTHKIKRLGIGKRNVILINVVAPLLFAYGLWNKSDIYQSRAIELLEQLKAEKNTIVDNWKKLGVPCITSGDSQALIGLKKDFCDQFKCLNCSIGHTLMTE